MYKMIILQNLLFTLLIITSASNPQDLPWPFTVIQESPFGRLYSVGINSTAPTEDSYVNISFYLDPLRQGFRFSPSLDAKTNSTELKAVSKWGPDYYTFLNPCPVGMTCWLWCAYPSTALLSGQSVMFNITSSLHRQSENSWVIGLKLPVNSKKSKEQDDHVINLMEESKQ